jgi:hypothetical protein
LHVCYLFYMIGGYGASNFCPFHPTGISASMNMNSFQTYWSCIKTFMVLKLMNIKTAVFWNISLVITNISKERVSSTFIMEEYVLSKKYRILLSVIHFLPAFIHLVVCLTTGPKPLPKPALHIVQSRASSFKWQYPLLSLTHCGRVTQICVFTLQLCRTGDANLRF